MLEVSNAWNRWIGGRREERLESGRRSIFELVFVSSSSDSLEDPDPS